MTAVEWLLEKISYSTSGGTIISHHKIITNLVEQAKEMEKEQKIEFACKVVEISSENYIQGKTTEQIAKELLTA